VSTGWGIAAAGKIARKVGGVIAAHPDMQVAAVGARDLDRAAALAGELGAPAAYGSYDEVVADPAVDAVYVATPHTRHAAVVETALAAGKAVLCEKPMTASLAETERLVALAERSGAFLMEAMWMRFNPLAVRLAELVRAGDLGEVRSLQATFGFAAPADPTDRLWDPALGGGALLDPGIYTHEIARMVLGDPTEIEASGSFGPTGADAESTTVLHYPGGVRAVLTQSLVASLPGSALVLGSRGWARLGPAFHAATELEISVDGGPVHSERHLDRQAGYTGELEEVARCLAAGRAQSDVVPLASSVSLMRGLEEALRQLH